MTSKLPWVAAAAIIVVAAVGAWTLLGTPATPTGGTEDWQLVQVVSPSQATAYGGQKSGVVALHFMKHDSGYATTENMENFAQANDNRIGSLFASGGTLATFPFDTRFDIVIAVVGNDDNMGQLNINYLGVELTAHKDSGWTLAAENDNNSMESIYVTQGTDNLFVNAKWDNNGAGYIISADDNFYLDAVKLWLRG